MKQFSDLVGSTIAHIEGGRGGNTLTFGLSDGTTAMLYHDQDCCEHVYLEDVAGDLQDLIGTPLLIAEEVSNATEPEHSYGDDAHQWTFYKLATIKGHVTLRWLGESNGYYSMAVDFAWTD
jgi:hypothetical protein